MKCLPQRAPNVCDECWHLKRAECSKAPSATSSAPAEIPVEHAREEDEELSSMLGMHLVAV